MSLVHQNRYSLKTKLAVVKSQDPYLFSNIPRSTARYWLDSIELDEESEVEQKMAELIVEVKNLEKKFEESEIRLKLLETVVAAFEIKFNKIDLMSAEKKRLILDSVNSGRRVLTLKSCLEQIGFSKSRYLRWNKREKQCCLGSYSRCPKKLVRQLTSLEMKKMEELFRDEELVHFSVPSLCLYAKRKNLLFCSDETWRKYIKLHKWGRLRERVYPVKPKVGVRTCAPDEVWHMDVTEYKLPDNTKCFIQVIIDNYSRFIVGWSVSRRKTGSISKINLENAFEKKLIKGLKLFVDDGGENVNGDVEEVLSLNKVKRVIAQLDVSESNSMVEAFFRMLKHDYLFNQTIQSFKQLEAKVKYYINEHNSKIPKVVLKGATPEEIYQGVWSEDNRSKIRERQKEVLKERVVFHQNLICTEVAKN